MTAYYKAKLNKGGKEESNRKKQKQDASPSQELRQPGKEGQRPSAQSSLSWSYCHASSQSPCSVVWDRQAGRWRTEWEHGEAL